MERKFVFENAQQLERLRKVVQSLTDEELSLPLSAGWTIAVSLAHLAFWDQWALVLLRQWKKNGVAVTWLDANNMNDALLPLCLAIPPRAAANLAIASAKAIDRELEEAPPELVTAIEGLKHPARLYRSIHRKLHLDEIDTVLTTKNHEIG
jgi:Mycothiol maleylpyruvate isomerase N-terminal domain